MHLASFSSVAYALPYATALQYKSAPLIQRGKTTAGHGGVLNLCLRQRIAGNLQRTHTSADVLWTGTPLPFATTVPLNRVAGAWRRGWLSSGGML